MNDQQAAACKRFDQLVRSFKRARRKASILRKASAIMDLYEKNKRHLGGDDFEKFMKYHFPRKLCRTRCDDSNITCRYVLSFLVPHLVEQVPLPGGDGTIARSFKLHELSDYFVSMWESHEDSYPTPTSSSVEYFLRHVTERRLLVGPKKVTDFREEIQVSCSKWPYSTMFLVLFCKPHEILALLRHGARFFAEDLDRPETLQPLAAAMLTFFNVKVIFDGEDDSLQEVIHSVVTIVIGKLLMTLKNPHLATYLIAGVSMPDPDFEGTFTLPDIGQLLMLYDERFPGSMLGRLRPASLKHSSRHCIREILNENWKLPGGVSELGLPLELQEYLNLN